MACKRQERFYILTLGCPKNQVDSEGISEQLVEHGFLPASRPEDADYVIVNTCGFLQAARQEALSTLHDLASTRRHGQQLIAAGCLAQRLGIGLAHEAPGVDGIIGVRNWPDMPALLHQLSQRAGRRRGTAEPVCHVQDTSCVPVEQVALRRNSQGARSSAYLKIGDGCSAECAFCAIPAIKGPACSRPKNLIVCEARALVEAGVGEIILIAQDTTAYGRDRGERDGLPSLVEDVLHSTPELRWLRLMYAYPGHAGDRLIEVMTVHPQVCHYLDMPVQHGHPDTLRRMRRPHNVEAMLRWTEVLRAAMPDIALRTSLIVGYPGETEAEFQGMLDLMSAAQFDRAGVFQYSREPGTAAYDLPGQVPETVKKERYERAMQHQQAISLARNLAQIGRHLDVLVEGCGDGISVARSYRDAPEVDGLVLIRGEHSPGTWLPVRVTDATVYDLVAVSHQRVPDGDRSDFDE